MFKLGILETPAFSCRDEISCLQDSAFCECRVIGAASVDFMSVASFPMIRVVCFSSAGSVITGLMITIFSGSRVIVAATEVFEPKASILKIGVVCFSSVGSVNLCLMTRLLWVQSY